ncbi:MAG: helix-turn-helix transcriptional regulator [Deltaproteobacteria bacterium]|nr:helix-turn-helix transcriptional regulator [Deltaproteobacteria bacterium]
MRLRLAEARKRRGLTQEQLAERAGMHRSTIARMEISNIGWTHQTIDVLADALQCPTYELFGYHHPPEATLDAETLEAITILEGLNPDARREALDHIKVVQRRHNKTGG